MNAVFIGASNELGEFESGVTAAWWGVVPAVVVGGGATLAVAALWTRLFPRALAPRPVPRQRGDPERRTSTRLTAPARIGARIGR